MLASPSANAPVRQLGNFVLIAGLLLATWGYIAPIYLTAVIPLTNSLLAWESLPLALQWQDGQLLLACRQLDGSLRHFLFAGHETTLFTAVAAFALFAATPGYSLRWRLGWLAGTTVLFGLVSALILCAGAHLAFLDYLGGSAPAYRQQLLAAGTRLLDAEQQTALEHRVGMLSVWGNPALLLTVWFFAVRRRYLPTLRPRRLRI